MNWPIIRMSAGHNGISTCFGARPVISAKAAAAVLAWRSANAVGRSQDGGTSATLTAADHGDRHGVVRSYFG
ncbi:MAG TPA: hypothetical protein VHF06_25790 [Pseudonocardiaceae bacterium]|nr:hypothetical protein [Pseudonocardiaceae bacterium]